MAGKTERVPTWGDVTPEGVARLLPRIGMPRRGGSSLLGRGPAFRNGDLVVSEEFVRRYATGIADLNPLYIDQDRKSVV